MMRCFPHIFSMRKVQYHSKPFRTQVCVPQVNTFFAVCLPNPLRYNPTAPTPYLRTRQNQIRALIPKVSYPDWVD